MPGPCATVRYLFSAVAGGKEEEEGAAWATLLPLVAAVRTFDSLAWLRCIHSSERRLHPYTLHRSRQQTDDGRRRVSKQRSIHMMARSYSGGNKQTSGQWPALGYGQKIYSISKRHENLNQLNISILRLKPILSSIFFLHFLTIIYIHYKIVGTIHARDGPVHDGYEKK